jgi:hypothetical protein
MNKSLITKRGLTRTLTQACVAKLMYVGPINNGNITIEFKTEAEGVRLAKKYSRLASNPSIQMNVTFKKIN